MVLDAPRGWGRWVTGARRARVEENAPAGLPFATFIKKDGNEWTVPWGFWSTYEGALSWMYLVAHTGAALRCLKGTDPQRMAAESSVFWAILRQGRVLPDALSALEAQRAALSQTYVAAWGLGPTACPSADLVADFVRLAIEAAGLAGNAFSQKGRYGAAALGYDGTPKIYAPGGAANEEKHMNTDASSEGNTSNGSNGHSPQGDNVARGSVGNRGAAGGAGFAHEEPGASKKKKIARSLWSKEDHADTVAELGKGHSARAFVDAANAKSGRNRTVKAYYTWVLERVRQLGEDDELKALLKGFRALQNDEKNGTASGNVESKPVRENKSPPLSRGSAPLKNESVVRRRTTPAVEDGLSDEALALALLQRGNKFDAVRLLVQGSARG
jgi:hypothetical protein